MNALNEEIAKPESRLGPEYKLGGAIFAKFAKYAGKEDPFGRLWSNHIANILREYLRGRSDRDKMLETLKDKFNTAVGKGSGGESAKPMESASPQP